MGAEPGPQRQPGGDHHPRQERRRRRDPDERADGRRPNLHLGRQDLDRHDRAGRRLHTITVAALDSSGQGVPVKTEISGRVDAVDMTGDTPQLVIGSIRVPLGSVKTLGLPAI